MAHMGVAYNQGYHFRITIDWDLNWGTIIWGSYHIYIYIYRFSSHKPCD